VSPHGEHAASQLFTYTHDPFHLACSLPPLLLSLPSYLLPSQPMVVTQEGKLKSVRSKKATRRVSGAIRNNIPFNKAEVITHTQVARRLKKRVLTKSTKVVVPVVPSGASKLLDSSPPSLPDQDIPSIPSKRTRKGPSRSAAVCFPPPPFSSTN
jgi:hypothetical protein